MSTVFGTNIKLTFFGQSHSPAVGVVIDGLPAGEAIDPDALQAFLNLRAPGRNILSTARKEADRPEILSGLAGGVTCGAPLALIIRNNDTRSSDYESLRYVPRPGHADLPAYVKYNGSNDIRGGGQFSARLTAPLCAAGGILLQILARRGVRVSAHIAEIAGISDLPFDPVDEGSQTAELLAAKDFPVIDDTAGSAMQEAILAARSEGDSIGGIVECMITGLPAGLGEPMYGSVEGIISQAVFGIPAVKGIEFGAGFAAALMRGSENNDPFCADPAYMKMLQKDGRSATPQEAGAHIRSVSNNHGGILGGLTSGMPVIFRAAFKPTPSIAKTQRSVDLRTLEETELIISGRHDPCVVPRAVPCVIAAAAVAAAQIIL